MSLFASRLKELRKSKGLTQMELARELGISKSTIAMYEIGERAATTENYEAIADYFNVDIDYLIGRKEKKNTTVVIDTSSITESEYYQSMQYAIDYMNSLTNDEYLVLGTMSKLGKNDKIKLLNVLQAMFPEQYKQAKEEIENED